MNTEKPSYEELENRLHKLEENAHFFQIIADNTYDWEILRDKNWNTILYSNNAFERITGYKNKDFINGTISFKDIVHPEDIEKMESEIQLVLNQNTVTDFEFRIVRIDKKIKTLNLCAQPVYKNNEFFGIRTSIRDITDSNVIEQLKIAKEKAEENERVFKDQNDEYIQLNEELRQSNEDLFHTKLIAETNAHLLKKQNEEIELNNNRLEGLLRIAQFNSNNVQDFLDFALNEAISLTSSKIGYIYFYNESTRKFILNTWSKNVMNECKVMNPQTVYDLDSTGCWGEAVRQRKPIVINDYQAENPHKKGTPEGHVNLSKFLTIPVFFDKKIVAVAGVANKTEDYNDSDIRQLTLLMDSVWRISERINLIDNLKSAIANAEESDFRLRLATESGQLGIWDWNVQDNVMIWNDRMFELYGIKTDAFSNNVDAWTNGLHPDDKQRAIDECNAALKGEKDFNTTFRVVHPDGKILYLKANAIVVKDSENKALRMIGINRDITDFKQAEEQLILAKEKAEVNELKFRNAFDFSGIGMALVNLNKRFIKVNKVIYEMLEYSEAEMLEKTILDITYFEDNNIGLNEIKDCIEGKLDYFKVSKRYVKKSGNILWANLNAAIIRNAEKFFVVQIEDITKQIEYQQNLYIAKEKAEESDRLKTAFLQNMSHEIRTPMNAIMGFSSILVNYYNDKPKLEKYSEIINRRCNDLLDIINDILDVAKIESGQMTLNNDECNLRQLFAELTEFFTEYQNRIEKQHIILHLEAMSDPHDNIIITDKVKLKQIFINLLSNAFKFTNAGAIVGGCKIDKNNQLQFYITDTGIGIPKDKQQIIFERFTQLDPGANKLESGTGLGLSIVKGLVNLMGGEIKLESEPNKGSTFSFTISYKEPQPVQRVAQVIEKAIPTNFYNKTILIVEDDLFNAEYLQEILSNYGFNILHTIFGNEAVQIALKDNIDLILMDIRLPDINGYEAISQIRKEKQNIKIIAQTAYASDEERQKALNFGCDDYISKPTEKNLLMEMISRHLSLNG